MLPGCRGTGFWCGNQIKYTLFQEEEIFAKYPGMCVYQQKEAKGRGDVGVGMYLCVCNRGSIVHSFTTCSIMIIKTLLETPRILGKYAE